MMFDLFDRLMSSQEDSLAKIYPWLDDVLALVESGAGCGGSSIGLLGSSLPPSFSSKTSLACYRPGLRPLSRQVEYRAEKNEDGEWCWTKRVISTRSFAGWKNSGMGGPTGFVTLNTSVWPSDGSVCSLSRVLEATWTVPQKYFLSPTACRGILRHAARRGERVAASLTAGVAASRGVNRPGRRREDDVNVVAAEVSPALSASGRGTSVCELSSAEQHDGDGTLRHKRVLAFDERNVTSKTNRSRVKPGLPSHTLHASPPTVAFAIQERAVSDNLTNGPGGKGFQPELANTLEARHHQQSVAQRQGVRRLMPVECEKLQGLPDGHTAWGINEKGERVEMSDSARYRMIGNGVSVPVIEWIAKRTRKMMESML